MRSVGRLEWSRRFVRNLRRVVAGLGLIALGIAVSLLFSKSGPPWVEWVVLGLGIAGMALGVGGVIRQARDHVRTDISEP